MSDQTTTPEKKKLFNEELCKQVNAYLDTHPDLTKTALAKSVGYSASTLSRYLSGKPEGDVPKLEAMLEDVMKSLERKPDADGEIALHDNKVSDIMEGAFETIRDVGTMGGVFGEGGVGKTCGISLYRAKNPTAVLITASEFEGSGPEMRKQMWDRIETRGYKCWEGSRADFLVKKFKGSKRLIIVDECHELKNTGRRFFRHFHDKTGCPIAYVGNPLFLKKISSDSQHSSRLYYVKVLEPDATERNARRIVESFANGQWDAIKDLALQVVANPGHCRALRMQVKLALEFREKTGEPFRECFLATHSRMIRDYALKS